MKETRVESVGEVMARVAVALDLKGDAAPSLEKRLVFWLAAVFAIAAAPGFGQGGGDLDPSF